MQNVLLLRLICVIGNKRWDKRWGWIRRIHRKNLLLSTVCTVPYKHFFQNCFLLNRAFYCDRKEFYNDMLLQYGQYHLLPNRREPMREASLLTGLLQTVFCDSDMLVVVCHIADLLCEKEVVHYV